MYRCDENGENKQPVEPSKPDEQPAPEQKTE